MAQGNRLCGMWPPGLVHFWPQGHNLNKLGRGPLADATYQITGLRSTVGNVSGNRCESDCRSRGREFEPRPVPYFHGDWSWNNFYSHSPPFRWIIQEGLCSVTSESMCTKYWLTACSSLPRKKVCLGELTVPAMTIAVDLGRKATKQIHTKYKGSRPYGFRQ